ncbi:universal stress protein [Streptomyces massasporeus]|uniref:Universal stress protein n=1 Tax=Streptomyces massasporeus TaxID=67324 RepID=A0ABW6LB01_9ACTN
MPTAGRLSLPVAFGRPRATSHGSGTAQNDHLRAACIGAILHRYVKREGWRTCGCCGGHGRRQPGLLCASGRAELLVLGSRGRGGFHRLALGSVSHQLLRYSACPVAIVRPRPEPSPS